MRPPPALLRDIPLHEIVARRRYRLLARVVALGCILSSPVWLRWLFFSVIESPQLPSLIFVPLMVTGCVVAFMPLWQGNPYLKHLLGTGILARLAATSLYIWIGVFVYDTSVDAFHYWSVGLARAADFSMMGWSAFQPPFSSTNLINNICGLIMLATGNTLPGLFVLFALAALWGGYLFYRAFCLAFPQGDHELYAVLAILLPSNLFWSSAIGKDALAQLLIGLTAYGFAKMNQRLHPRAVLTCALGIAGVLAVRPHIAAMLAVAVTMPFALGKTRGGWMYRAAKVVFVPLLVVVSLWLVGQASEFVGLETTNSQSGVETVNLLSENTQTGGSAFNSGQSLWVRVAESPFLMFRPFPWEVNNVMAGGASLEAVALLWFAWRRRRGLMAALRQWRTPFITFILTYSLVFSIAFAAATSNFGILVRERIMMAPLLLMLFCADLERADAKPLPSRPGWMLSSMRLSALGRQSAF